MALRPQGPRYQSAHGKTLTPPSERERSRQSAGLLPRSGFLSGMCRAQGLLNCPPVFELSASQNEEPRGVWTESTLGKTAEIVSAENCLLIEVFNCLFMIKPINILVVFFFPFLSRQRSTDSLHFSDARFAGGAFAKRGDKDGAVLLQRV